MKVSRGIAGPALASIIGLASMVTEVRAQSAWDAYSPNSPRGGPTSILATPTPLVGASGWAGYAPATAWTSYQPRRSWLGYVPQAGRSAGTSVASRPRAPRGAPISSENPEYGTGRTIAMIKPWLPPAP